MEQGAKDFLRGLCGHSVAAAGHCRVSRAYWQWRPGGLLPSAAVPGDGFCTGAGCVGPGMIAVRTAFPVISACGVCGLHR